MTRALALALALIPACAHDNAVSFRVFDTRARADDLEVLEEACALWELDCYTVSNRRSSHGSVTLILVDRGSVADDIEPGGPEVGLMINGWAQANGCEPVVLALGTVEVVAHELGHAIGGLEDRSTTSPNIMMETSASRFRTAGQLRRMRLGAERLALCTGGVAP